MGFTQHQVQDLHVTTNARRPFQFASCCMLVSARPLSEQQEVGLDSRRFRVDLNVKHLILKRWQRHQLLLQALNEQPQWWVLHNSTATVSICFQLLCWPAGPFCMHDCFPPQRNYTSLPLCIYRSNIDENQLDTPVTLFGSCAGWQGSDRGTQPAATLHLAHSCFPAAGPRRLPAWGRRDVHTARPSPTLGQTCGHRTCEL